MSGAHKALARQHAPAAAVAPTSLVAWGKSDNWQLGLGGKITSTSYPKPIGTPTQDVVQVALGYGEAVGLKANGDLLVWGLNQGGQVPFNFGPEEVWTGLWDYRTTLPGQVALEELGKTPSEIEAKERALEFPERATDKRKAIVGQVCYGVGQVVINTNPLHPERVGTYRAVIENCAREPGGPHDEGHWELVPIPVELFLKENKKHESVYYPYAFNLANARQAPMLKGRVAGVSMVAGHGAALLKADDPVNPSGVVMWGRTVNYGTAGQGWDGSWGPQPRPLGKPPSQTNTYYGQMFYATLSSELSTGGATTTLPVKATARSVGFGIKVLVTSGEHTQEWTVAAPASAGATSLTVVSQTPNFAYPTGSVVASKTIEGLAGVREKHFKSAISTSWGQGTTVNSDVAAPTKTLLPELDGTGKGERTIAAPIASVVITSRPTAGVVTLEVIDATHTRLKMVGGEPKAKNVQVGTEIKVLPEGTKLLEAITELYVEAGAEVGTLSSTLVPGALTSLPVNALTKEHAEAIKLGEPIQLDDGTHTQSWVVTLAPANGATSIKVESQVPFYGFASGTKVRLATTPSPERRKVFRNVLTGAALCPYGTLLVEDFENRFTTKKPAKEQKFWGVSEGALQSASWPIKVALPEAARCTAVAVGTNGGKFPFALAIDNHDGRGRVLAWGSNNNGQMGNEDATGGEHLQLKPGYVKSSTGGETFLENVVAIACGETFCMALDSSHRIWVWGKTENGQGGVTADNEGVKNTALPIQVTTGVSTTVGHRPVAIAASESTALFIDEAGKLFAWGKNENGECANGKEGGTNQNQRWKTGHAYSVNNKSYSKGVNYKCIVAVTSSTEPGSDPTHWEIENYPAQPEPKEIAGITGKVTWCAGGRSHLACVTDGGKCYTWGSNAYGQIGNSKTGKFGKDPNHPTPFEVPLEGKKALSVDCGEWGTQCVIEGHTPVKRPFGIHFTPGGEVGGEPSAGTVHLEWRSSTGVSGWVLKFSRQPTWWEEAELTLELEDAEEELAELEENEAEKEEIEVAEELVAALLKIQQEQNEGVSTIPGFAPKETSAGSGVLYYDWKPPGALTPTQNYNLTLTKESIEAAKGKDAALFPTGWQKVTMPTASVWGSPSTFAVPLV